MARKLGVKRKIESHFWDYNMGLAGLSGIGKTTIVNEILDKKLGRENYLYFDLGKESGAKVLNLLDAPVETFKTWKEIEAGIKEVILNRTTDYESVKMIAFDTLDQMFDLAEKEAIREWNRNNPDKKAESINTVRGYGKGLDYVVDMVLGLLFSLDAVGIRFFVVMHTKPKDLVDTITGEPYQVITASLSQKYFNSVKSKLDLLGVAYVDRTIITEKLKSKDIKGNNKTRNVIAGEARKISFRSDDYNLDSKSRFPTIVSNIEMDSEQFVNAVEDAILGVVKRAGKDINEVRDEQEKVDAERLKEIAKDEIIAKEKQVIEEGINKIIIYVKQNLTNKDVVNELLVEVKKLGFNDPTLIDNEKDLNTILKLIK